MKNPVLLTRDQFREATFARDKHRCVFCGDSTVFAHHIIERRLFDNGGYFLDNGATVCDLHHRQCEMTVISVEKVREACGIKNVVVPDHFIEGEIYDKWGNPVLPNKMRLKGELFFEDSVQKILLLGGVLSDFSNEVKYPRTNHVPWSQSVQSDDRVYRDMSFFHGKRVIVTKKMDGENTSMYRHTIHARSIDGTHHYTRDWVKAFWATLNYEIPEGWRICGENLWGQHSIIYQDLESYFQGFSIWDERNVALSWDDTLEWFDLLGITPVEVMYDGIYDEEAIKKLYKDSDWETLEGWVMRVADSFSYSQFRHSVAKFVRKGHVQTDKHWKEGDVKPNGLKK